MPDMYDRQAPDLAWAENFFTTKAKDEAEEDATIECPGCGAENPVGARVCEECGMSLKGVMTKSCGCGETNAITAKACRSCGGNFHKGGKETRRPESIVD